MKFNFEEENDKIIVNCWNEDNIIKHLIIRIYDLDTNIKLNEYSFSLLNYIRTWSIPPGTPYPISGYKIVIFENDIPIWIEHIYKKSICKTKFIDSENKLSLEINAALFLNYIEMYNLFQDDFFDIKNSKLILDLGSSVGIFTAYALECNTNVKSINVEMNPDFHKVCVETFKNNLNIIPINAAIYRESNKMVEISSSKKDFNDLGNSIFKQMYVDQIYKIETQTISLPDIIEKYNIEEIDLLKIDIEGYEYELFEHLSDDIVNKINKIFFEFHKIDDKERKMNLINRLIKLGFKMVMTSPIDIYNDSQFTIYFKK